MLASNSSIKLLIDNLWDSFWSGGISNPITAIEQISYLLFMRKLDDSEAKRERDAEWTGIPYESKFSGTYMPYSVSPGYYSSDRSRIVDGFDIISQQKEVAKRERPKSELRWSFFKSMAPADKQLEHVRYNVFPFIRGLSAEGTPFARHMANAVFIIEKPSLLTTAIKQIDLIFEQLEKDAESHGGDVAFQDIQGDMYENLLEEIATAGKNGQFRSPRHIIKLMADLVQPKIGQRICDPACGTGGFLLGAYQYILSDMVRQKDPGKLVRDRDGFERGALSSVLTPELKTVLDESLYGYDIDITMVRLGLMNLMMHGIDQPHIDFKDSLSKSFSEFGKFDVVMANPPFTGNIDKSDLNESLKTDTSKTELLFVEQIHHMLRTGGTAAIIVPQGVLFGGGKAFVAVRKLMMEQAELKAVVSLPGGVFKPYAGVATAILIFTKGGTSEKVWFYKMEHDRRSLDDKRTEGGPNDMPDIILQYHSRHQPGHGTDRKAKFFWVPKGEIEEQDYDLSFSKYEEKVFEEEDFGGTPKEILGRLKDLELTIQKGIEQLENTLI